MVVATGAAQALERAVATGEVAGVIALAAEAPTGRSAGSLAWAGLADTCFWLDPAKRVTGVILTQILPFADPAALGVFEQFERAIYAGLPMSTPSAVST